MEIYTTEWAENYERLAIAGIPGREGLYRVCKASLTNLPQGARILVVGCGTGSDLIPLAKALPTASFVAIDPAEPMLAFCSERVKSEGLSQRVTLQAKSLNSFQMPDNFDAATAILVSQHLAEDAAAAEFFCQIAQLLKPKGLLYSADLHIATDQDRERMLALWRDQALMSGTEMSVVEGLLSRFSSDLRPRDESAIVGFLHSAGFINILKPFSSLIYGAWVSEKGG